MFGDRNHPALSRAQSVLSPRSEPQRSAIPRALQNLAARSTARSGARSGAARDVARVASVALGLLMACASSSAATVYSFDDTSSSTIAFTSATVDTNPLGLCDTGGPGTIVTRTFDVAESFTITDVGLGLNISHTSRDDIVVVLESPAATRVVVLNDTSGDGDDNYDLIMVDNGELTDPDDGDDDDVDEPFYHREIDNNALNAFVGEDSMGTWTAFICDDTADTDGTLNAIRLVLESGGTLNAACGGTSTYDWGDNGDAAFTSATEGDVTITETRTRDVYSTAIAGSNFETATGQQGAEFGHYQFGFDSPDDESGAVIAEFEFDPPVHDLTLALLDIDQGNFEDMARMRGLDPSGTALPFDTVEAIPVFPDLFGDTYGGDAPVVPTNSSDGNVTYTFEGPVETLLVEYFTGSTPEDPGNQFLGLSDPVFCAYDFGDAPASYGTDGGAGPRHTLGSRLLFLGTEQADGEADGSPSATAAGDGFDEDGVASFPSGVIAAGDTYAVSVFVTNRSGASANLCGWVDFDLDGGAGDGTFESDEGFCATVPAAGSSNAICTESAMISGEFTCILSFTVPGDFTYVPDEATFARFRITSEALTTSNINTEVSDGEVEDFQIPANTLPVTLASFGSELRGGVPELRWSSASEILTVGYRIYGLSGDLPESSVASQSQLPETQGKRATTETPPVSVEEPMEVPGPEAPDAEIGGEGKPAGGSGGSGNNGPSEPAGPAGESDQAPAPGNPATDGEDSADGAGVTPAEPSSPWRLLTSWAASGESAGRPGAFVPASFGDPFAPRSYRVQLDPAEASLDWVLLAEVDHFGRERTHGPFRLGESYGSEPSPQIIDWARVAAAQGADSLAAAPSRWRAAALNARFGAGAGPSPDGDQETVPSAFVAVKAAGIYRLTHENLLASGVDLSGAPAEALALWSEQRGPQRLWVQPAAGPFGPGSVLEFFARGEEDSLHTQEHVFALGVDAARAIRPREVNTPPTASPSPSYLATEVTDRNLAYTFAAPSDDPWYETSVLAFGGLGQRELTFQVGPLDPARSGEAVLELTIWGITNWPGIAPDHHVVVAVNGQELAAERFDGLVERTLRLELPSGLLEEGENRILVQLPGDTGYDFDLIYVDRYAITYPRRFVADGDQLTFDDKGPAYSVSELTSPEVSVWSKEGRVRLDGLVVTPDVGGYQVAFRHPGSQPKSFHVAAGEGRLTPAVGPWRSPPEDLLTGAADYLILTHPAFRDGLGDLVAARQADGYAVKVVDIFDVYAAYSGQGIDPEAIRAYVADAYEQLGVRFLLLVGGDTSDPLDRLGLGSMSFLPTPYRATDALISFAPVDPLYGDVDGDGIPEVAVGRFPVRTIEDLQTVIAKTLAYPTSRNHAVFLADDTPSGLFTNTSESFRTKLGEGFTSEAYYLDAVGVEAARQGLFDAFDTGARLIHYLGHSGPAYWTFDGLFNAADIDSLTATGQPAAVVQWGCWNTYHVSPRYDTLGHRLLLAGPQGAAAVLGAATLTTVSSDRDLGERVLAALSESGVPIGTAILRAKTELHRAYGGQPPQDVMLGWTLLGDPALVVALE
ncbi:MAG: C25 family cysteine peptidase [Acidobacteriota bacterium]